jgi:hypothetical protein
MTNSPLPGTRPTVASLLQSGDKIALEVQTSFTGPTEYYLATITALEDDEPNRRINITPHIPALGQTATNPVKPGEMMRRLTDADDGREPVYVAARDLWKWEGLRINDPDGGDGKVQLMRAQRGPHPQDGHEILALVIEDQFGQRRAVGMEMTGGLFCEW